MTHPMTYAAFQDLIRRMLDDIPGEYLAGLQGVHVFEDVKPDPVEPELVRLGEYLDPGPDSSFGGQPGLGRQIALYFGSFQAVAGDDPRFDWEGEAWETLTHELQHHLESRAGEIGLIEWDRARLREFRARRG
jgi:hypothetical protein